MSLPELPEPNVLRPAFVYDAYGTIIDHAQPLGSYTPKQMHEYGQSCRKQALEEAAAMCESKHANGNHKYDTREECADAIKGMV